MGHTLTGLLTEYGVIPRIQDRGRRLHEGIPPALLGNFYITRKDNKEVF